MRPARPPCTRHSSPQPARSSAGATASLRAFLDRSSASLRRTPTPAFVYKETSRSRIADAGGPDERRHCMNTRALALLFAITAALLAPFAVGAQSPYPVVTGKAYKFEKIADGVYYATATGAMVTGSNNPVIVGQREVLVVDTGTSPAAARAFLADLKMITDKPVRYVVNTHFHYDHTDGNQVYAGKAQIIAHDYVKTAIQTLNVLQREPYKTSQLTNVPNRIETLKKQIASEQNATRKATVERQLAVTQQGWDELKEIKPTPPDVTYSTKKVINLGGREVQLLFLGRGHTNGDTVVYLPQEKIVCTGDPMESQLAYMGDAQ